MPEIFYQPTQYISILVAPSYSNCLTYFQPWVHRLPWSSLVLGLHSFTTLWLSLSPLLMRGRPAASASAYLYSSFPVGLSAGLSAFSLAPFIPLWCSWSYCFPFYVYFLFALPGGGRGFTSCCLSPYGHTHPVLFTPSPYLSSRITLLPN